MNTRRTVPALLLAALLAQGCGADPDEPAPAAAPTAARSPASPAAASAAEARPGWEPSPFRPAPYAGWLTSVPDDFPVEHRLGASEGAGSPAAGVAGRFCGTDPFPTLGVVDRVTASASGPEYAETRDLRLFADDRAAHRFLVAVADAVATCPEQEVEGTLWRHELRPSMLDGAEAFTAVQTFETDGTVHPGAGWWEVVREGNAVLLTATGGEWMPGRALDGGIRGHARQVAPLVDALCVFSRRGCGEPPGDGDIPDDFPLAAGWPDEETVEPGPRNGLEGPGRQVAALRFEACGGQLDDPGSRDRLGARWTNVEDHRSRELRSFADAGEAAGYVAALVGLYRSCPTEERGDGYTRVTEVRRTGVGGGSWAVVRGTEREGAPAVGLEVLHVVRLGRAVLVDAAANEGGAGQDPEADVRRQIRYQIRATIDVVAAMCAFTEAGCR